MQPSTAVAAGALDVLQIGLGHKRLSSRREMTRSDSGLHWKMSIATGSNGRSVTTFVDMEGTRRCCDGRSINLRYRS